MSENSSVTFSSVFFDKNPPIDERIDEMLQWCKKIHGFSSSQGPEDNLSFRTKMGFIITGSGLTLDNMTRDTTVEVRGVVFGLNRPSIYARGQVAPSEDALLHSGVYEAYPGINAIFFLISKNALEAAGEIGIPSIDTAQAKGSQEQVQEVVNLVKINKCIAPLILKNSGVLIPGKTMDEAGKLTEEMQKKATNGVKAKSGKKY